MTTKTTKKPVFKKIQRFDIDKAAKGVAHRIEDKNGNAYPVWTVRFFDQYNKFLKVENERFERENGKDPETTGKYSGVYAFVQVCVVDWTDMLDEDDNQIPFDKMLAYEYLCDDENAWFREQLIERSQDERYYKAVTPAATKVEDAGN